METIKNLPQKTQEEINQCCKDQKALCNEKGYPDFAAHDGYCYSCRKNVYQNYGNHAGYTGKSLVTGCPHCNISYCD